MTNSEEEQFPAMRFMPHTEADLRAMLDTVGAASIDDLIAHVPAELRESAKMALAPGLGEQAVAAEMAALASRNRGADFISFHGGGYYNHYVPAVVRAVTSRAEFATSYTPYQAEASQGTTQAIFEFQTLITQLTGLAVANASMYDGASAAAEAVLMAHRIAPKRTVVALSRALWPDYRATIRTYLSALSGSQIVEVPFDNDSGRIDLAELRKLADDNLLCVVAGYPNGFGIIEPLQEVANIAHQAGASAISATAEALALGLLKSPGELGIDIAVGEGQSFGMPLQYGGPGLGFMAAREAHLRRMPGRLVGQTRDAAGKRAFTLTLATREQHIRRERATSNICTNHSLCALAATVYLAMMGRRGLRELAERNVELAHQAHDALAAKNLAPRFSGPFFNEFMVKVPRAAAFLEAAEQRGILAGLPMTPDYPELDDAVLIAVTEMNRADDLARLAGALAKTL
ncbi:MAG TPA: aminomethyl-transferring glycine dehydrogenase subunit GcvPA [Candidatus Binataceae bacterium]|nr:aminomethyl-transferring glycine dehydrogenase subunit GcvPA [Candidatus Binataceae bacterium]